MVEAMEIQEGFKQTEVGVIPSDWDYDEIQYLAGITTGAKNTQDRVSDGAYPFFVRSQTVERINSYSYDGVAVLTAGDGVGTGKVFHYINGKFDFHQRVYKISEFAERLDGYFFYLYFSKNFYNRIMQMTAKSSVDSVRREMIAKMLIPLPTKAEQTAIATALNDADALITQLEQLIAKKRAIKQGAMQELLTGEKNLDGYNDDWHEIELRGIVDQFIVPMRDKPKRFSGDTPWCRIEDFEGKYLYDSKAKQYVDESTILAMNLKVFPKETLIVSCSADLGRCAILKRPLVTNQTFIGLVVNKVKASNEFLYYFMGFNSERLNQLSSGTTIAYLSREQFESFKVIIPKTKDEQTHIAQILSDMDAEIEALENKLNKYKMIKQGMMQNLLTGKIRLI